MALWGMSEAFTWGRYLVHLACSLFRSGTFSLLSTQELLAAKGLVVFTGPFVGMLRLEASMQIMFIKQPSRQKKCKIFQCTVGFKATVVLLEGFCFQF
ncbi:hypothetical protein XENTR_v10011933 [Xenopus tropicalis]|nr:hypothetical protein XENTR_v10011933 [Xenopus tropicalis]